MKRVVREQFGLMEIQTETFAEISVPRAIVSHGINTVANGKIRNAFQKIQVNKNMKYSNKRKNIQLSLNLFLKILLFHISL